MINILNLFHFFYSNGIKKMLNIHKTGYPSSELVSRVFTGCPLVYNMHPKNYSSETDKERIETFESICCFNYHLTCIEKKILIATIKFPQNFRKAIENPTEKTKKAADFYPDWFKMCCHLKYLGDHLELFKLFSSLSQKYNEKKCETFWKNCKPQWGSIPGVFSIIDKCIPPEAKIPNRRELIKKTFFSSGGK